MLLAFYHYLKRDDNLVSLRRSLISSECGESGSRAVEGSAAAKLKPVRDLPIYPVETTDSTTPLKKHTDVNPIFTESVQEPDLQDALHSQGWRGGPPGQYQET